MMYDYVWLWVVKSEGGKIDEQWKIKGPRKIGDEAQLSASATCTC